MLSGYIIILVEENNCDKINCTYDFIYVSKSVLDI